MAIREVIPSVTTALTRLNQNPENRKLSKLTKNSRAYNFMGNYDIDFIK